MEKLSWKIISSIIGVTAAGAITVTAAVTSQPKVAQTNASSAEISSYVVSSTASSALSSASASSIASAAAPSKGKVEAVADGVNQIQKATDEGVSKIHDETDKAVSQIQADQKAKDDLKAKKAARLKEQIEESKKCPVINPSTGEMVWPEDSGYEEFKAQLGGDAGTVDPDKSTACQAALKQAQAKLAAQREAEKAANSLGGKSDQIISTH